jgi:hypothetical protein
MITPNLPVPGVNRVRPLRVIATWMALLALVTQSFLIVGVSTVSAQSRQQKTLSKKKKSKKKRSQPQLQSVGAYAMPDSPKISTTVTTAPGETQTTTQSPRTKRSVSIERQPDASATSEIREASVTPVQSVVVDVRKLSAKPKSTGPRITGSQQVTVTQEMPIPGSISEVDTPLEAKPTAEAQIDVGGPLVPSPAPAQNFQGAVDEAIGGGPSGTFTIPPDTMGAVGLDKVVTMVNNNLVIQNKATGAVLSLVGMTSFWAAAGGTGHFDPRIQYDPYNNRWLVAAVSNAQTANSSVLVGVSNTPDPQGTFTLFRFIVGCAPGSPGCNAQGGWADFPMLGFNKNWLVVTWNQFTINTLAFTDGRALVLDYPTLRGGTAIGSIFTGVSAAIGGFCMHPATTFSPTENTLYLPTHLGSLAATYRLHSLTGTPSSPTLNVDPANRTRPGGGWTQPGQDALPQQCIAGVVPGHTCPATIRRIHAGDAFIRSNVVFRNGKIYYPQTIALPATGTLTTGSHFAAQWTALNTDGTFFDGGRVEDATATLINGGKNYAYPSLSVNKNNDILFGFSETESDDYADAGYTFRLGTDAAGTMRDPVIYKDGEDYYSKTFGGTLNRWGDYTHTVVDPVNDRDLWTLQEYPRLRVGTTGQGTNDSRWGTWWAKIAAPAAAGDLIISEFRLRGPGGANDEFVEIYNPNSSPFTVATVDASSGYALAASDGTARFIIPNGTVIPALGHYLGVNSVGYSLASYPAADSTTASGDATYTTDILVNAGIALFNTSNPTNFTLANRLDAVGSTTETNALYKEGTGYPALTLTTAPLEDSFLRTFCPNNVGVFGTALGCTPGGGATPKDTNNNAQDFLYVDSNGTVSPQGQRLGAPGPENLSSPIERNATLPMVLLDSSVAASSPPNRVRILTPGPGATSSNGTLTIRRRVVNGTGAPVTRLRFRIIDINTFPAPVGFADLRAVTSTGALIVGINDAGTCGGPPPCSVSVSGLTLEQPPNQPNGGGFNSSLSSGMVTLITPLAPGASVNLEFLLGVQQPGNFRFFVNIEALP